MKLRPEVQWFAEEMEKRLRVHDPEKGKKGWKKLNPHHLIDDILSSNDLAFEGGVVNLYDAMCQEEVKKDQIIHAAANVANFAMMIADIYNIQLRKKS